LSVVREATSGVLREDRPYGGRTLEERRHDQRGRLLHAAREVFAESGYAAASIEEIVARARVSRTTFYDFFPNKEECLLAVFLDGSERLLDVLREVASWDVDVVVKVRVGVERFVAALASDPAMAQVVLIEAVGAGPRVEEARAQVRRRFAEVIELQLSGVDFWRERPAEEAHLAAMATMAALAEPVSDLVATGKLEQWRRLVEPLSRYALRALGPDLAAT
jgi:AcrR family transcriptional regulator